MKENEQQPPTIKELLKEVESMKQQPQQPQGKFSAEFIVRKYATNNGDSINPHYILDERDAIAAIQEYTEQFNKPTQKTLADLSYVPSQLCPKCHGKGFMQLSGTTSATTNICDVCGGNKIIYQ